MIIEKGIEIPEPSKTRGPGCKSVYPFREMQVGDSVFYESKNYNSAPMAAAKVYAKRLGFKFSGRVMDGGLRIWRVE